MAEKLRKIPERKNILWPEWSDNDINTEIWDLQKTKDASLTLNSTRSNSIQTTFSTFVVVDLFEDVYPVPLPPSIGSDYTWTRMPTYRPGVKQVISYRETAPFPDLVSPNEHLLHSEFMRAFISSVHTLMYLGYTHPFIVEWQTSTFSSNTSGIAWKPWYHIYSKGKTGKGLPHAPQVNTLGKYAVRLYWMGCWRKILVDDKCPLNKTGESMLPTTFCNNKGEVELWPILLTKALLKIASMTWTNEREIVDFDIITCLTGWPCQVVNTKGRDRADIWNMCYAYTNHFHWPEEQSENMSEPNLSRHHRKINPRHADNISMLNNLSQKSSANSSKSSKSFLGDGADGYHLLLACDNMRDLSRSVIENVTPCWNHRFLLEEIRDIPLIKPGSDPSKILPLWKTIRWEQWAIERGLWEKEEIPTEIKYLKVISAFHNIDEENIEDLTFNSTINSMKIKSAKLAHSTKLHDSKNLNESSKLDNSKKTKNVSKRSSKMNESQRNNKQNLSKTKAAAVSKKARKLLETAKYVDPSVWCNFYNFCDHITSITIYYKPSNFKTSVILSDIQFNETSESKPRRLSRRDDTKNKSDVPLENSIKAIHWKNISAKPENEPVYLFIDSVDCKLTLFSLAHVGKDFPHELPPIKTIQKEESKCPVFAHKSKMCTDLCMCHEYTEPIKEEKNDTIPKSRTAYLIVEKYNWKKHQSAESVLFMDTFGTKTFMIHLEKGRQIYRLWLESEELHILTAYCNTEFVLGTIDEILPYMTSESQIFTEFSYNVSAAFGNLLTNFGTFNYSYALHEFYNSYKPTTTLDKKSAELIHKIFLKEFLIMLCSLCSEEDKKPFEFALRVIFLNPNIKICGVEITVTEDIEDKNGCICVDTERMKLEEASAIKIQAFFKMIYMKKLHKLHDPSDKRFEKILNNLKSIYFIAFSSFLQKCPCNEILRRMNRNINLSEFQQHFPYANDIESVLDLNEINGKLKDIEPYTWVPITRITFNCKDSSPNLIKVYTFCNLPKYVVRIYNNDTETEMGRCLNNEVVYEHEENQNGYTIFAYGWSHDKPIEFADWTIFIATIRLTNSPFIQTNTFTLEKKILYGNYVPNLSNLICRCLIKVREATPVTFRFSTSTEDVQINLQCFTKEGILLKEVSGKTNVLLPLIPVENTTYVEPETKKPSITKEKPKRLSSYTKRQSSIDKASIVSIKSVRRKSKLTNIVNTEGCTDYYIQAVLKNDSWPLTVSEWNLVEEIKSRNNIEQDIPYVDTTPRNDSIPARKKTRTSRKSLEKLKRYSTNKSINKIKTYEMARPFWHLDSVYDTGKIAAVEIDQEKLNKIKEMKRQYFEENPKRLPQGKKLRNDFLKQHYIKWPKNSGSEESVLDYENFTRPNKLFHTSSKYDLLNSMKMYSKVSVNSFYKSNLEQYHCPKCQKPFPLKQVAYLRRPDPIDKMLPPFNINKLKERYDMCRTYLNGENVAKMYANLDADIENYKKWKEETTQKMNEYMLEKKRRDEIMNKWHQSIRAESLNIVKENQMLKEKYKQKLIEEKLAAAKLKKNKKKGKK